MPFVSQCKNNAFILGINVLAIFSRLFNAKVISVAVVSFRANNSPAYSINCFLFLMFSPVDILMLSNTCKISSPRSVIYSMSSLPILLTGFTVFIGFFLFFLSIFLIMALIIFLSVSVKIEFT